MVENNNSNNNYNLQTNDGDPHAGGIPISSSASSNNKYSYYYGPEGRLVLVDSAIEAVNRGSTTIGIKTKEFAIISSHIKPIRPLVEPSQKIFKIDDHVGATGSGYVSDLLQLIDEIRLQSQRYRLNYETPVDIGTLVKTLSSYLHKYTIYAIRPQAASILIAGKDQTGINLFQIDPSGTYFRGSAFAIGQFSETALRVLLQDYNENMTLDQALDLSKKTFEKALNEKPLLETGVVTLKEGKFYKI